MAILWFPQWIQFSRWRNHLTGKSGLGWFLGGSFPLLLPFLLLQCHLLLPKELDKDFGVQCCWQHNWKVRILIFSPLKAKRRVLPPGGGTRSEVLTVIWASWLRRHNSARDLLLVWLLGLTAGKAPPGPGQQHRSLYFQAPCGSAEAFLHRHIAWNCLCSLSAEVGDCTEVESNPFTSITHPSWSGSWVLVLQRDLCGQVWSCTCPARQFGEQGLFSD